MEENFEELVEVLEGRRDLYRTLECFYYQKLRQDQIDAMAATDFTVFGGDDPLLVEGFNDITRYLRKRDTGTRQNLAVDFTSVFIGTRTYEGKSAEPFESLFRGEEGRLGDKPAGEVYNEFKHERLKVAEGVNLPSDHLSFEMEYLAVMSERAAEALRAGDSAAALANVRKQRAFLDEHILSWFDDFKRRAEFMLKTRFYRGVLKVTKGYLEFDKSTLDDLIAALSGEDAREAAGVKADVMQGSVDAQVGEPASGARGAVRAVEAHVGVAAADIAREKKVS